MVAGETSPPKPLSEASLISLMNKNGIGTDYTSPEQIKNIQEREYVIKNGNVLCPTKLGTSLVDVYAKMNIDLYKLNLRATMEAEIKCIAEGSKPAGDVF